jgi:hypothetical protein
MAMTLRNTSTLASPAHLAGLFAQRGAGEIGRLFGRRSIPREPYDARWLRAATNLAPH